MKLSQAKEYLPLVQAAAEGKTIQIKRKNGGVYREWTDIDASFYELFRYDDAVEGYEYRIKPTPKLRPWKPEEAIGKHIRHKATQEVGTVLGFTHGGLIKDSLSEETSSFDGEFPEWYFENCETVEGKPCGVEESQ